MADDKESSETAKETTKASKKSKGLKRFATKRNLKVLLVLIVLGALGFFIYQYHQQKKEIARLSNPQAVAQQEQQQLIDSVGKLTDLPKGETPTVATVSDTNKLKDQPFFANAENGDKVLIYSQAKLAILYRPSTDKVIQISSVNLGSQ